MAKSPDILSGQPRNTDIMLLTILFETGLKKKQFPKK
jgi:hypothetical protein